MIDIKIFKVGRFKTNCYLVSDESQGNAILIDPGGKIKDFENEILAKYDLKYILITHGHFDHILNAGKYKKLSKAKIVFPQGDKQFIFDNNLNLSNRFLRSNVFEVFEPDIFVEDSSEIIFNDKKIKVLSTPGHTRGSVSYIIDDNIFSGDTLFCGTVGCTDFPTGNKQELKNSLRKIMSLKGEYKVYPGHSKPTLLSLERNHLENI